MPLKSVWIVDDDRSIRWVFEKALQREGIACRLFESATDALEQLTRDPPQVVVSDIRMPGVSGITLLERIRADHPQVPVIIMTAYSDLESAVSAFQGGAFEYLPKPFDVDAALELIRKALDESRRNTDKAEPEEEVPEMLGQAPAMQEVFRAIGRLSQSHATVLITGESGSGKELVARALHRHSPRSSRPFIAINTAAIPRDLLESELFGHERGAFTGAQTTRQGRFEQAEGGTLFLDEIGEIDLNTQVKLLRAIGERTIERLGSNKPLKVDVRVVAATNKDLSEMVREGTFRDDLFFRLNVVSIAMPPLRSRKEDIVLLVDAFLKEFTEENGKAPMELTAEAMQWLLDYEWPGNVRELRTVIEHGVVMSNTPKIGVRHLPMFLRDDSLRDLRGGGTPKPKTSVVVPSSEPEDLNLARTEERLIRLALDRTGDHRTEAAKLLGISRRTMQRKLKEMGLVEE